MGGYCKFCNQRCFRFFPDETPQHILEAYGTSNIIATCPGGQQFEREQVGFCLDDIEKAITNTAATQSHFVETGERDSPGVPNNCADRDTFNTIYCGGHSEFPAMN